MASPVDSTRIFVIKIVGEVSLLFLKLLKSRSLNNACFAEPMSARHVDTQRKKGACGKIPLTECTLRQIESKRILIEFALKIFNLKILSFF